MRIKKQIIFTSIGSSLRGQLVSHSKIWFVVWLNYQPKNDGEKATLSQTNSYLVDVYIVQEKWPRDPLKD